MRKPLTTILASIFLMVMMIASVEAQPTAPPSSPTNDDQDVVSVYSDAFATNIATNINPGWGQSTSFNELNFDGNKVLEYGNLNYQGLEYTSTNVSGMEYVHLDYYTDNSTQIDFYLIAGGENAYSIGGELGITTGQWVSVDIELSSAFAARDLTAAYQFKTVGNGTVYLDNLYFWKAPTAAGSDATLSDLKIDDSSITGFVPTGYDYTVGLVNGSAVPQITSAPTTDASASAVITQATSVPGAATVVVTSANTSVTQTYTINFNYTTPNTAAPTPPARDANEVIAVFSDAYTEISGSDFNPGWGQTTGSSTVNIESNPTLKYINFNYQGTQLGSVQDLSGMAYMHIDMWTGNATAVGISPISQTTGEKRVDLDITKYEWVGYDIPLSDFTSQGLGITDIHQLKFDQGTSKESIYLDNIYFYAADVGGEPVTSSSYCETQVTHFGIEAETASAIQLTVTNVDATSMSIEIESADSDPVDELIVTGGSGAAISEKDESVSGKIKRTLTWTSAPDNVTFNLLWSKASFGGNWQLSQTDISVPFGASCSSQDLSVSSSQTSTGDMNIGNLTIDAGQTLTIAAGHTLTVNGSITNNGDLVISSGASLITFDGNTTGNVTIKRNTRYSDGKYSFVGTPVAADASITGADLGSVVYWYDETIAYGDDGLARWKDASAEQLTPGMGYAQAFQEEISFTGVPNDGEIVVSGLSHTAPDSKHGEHGWQLLSNPYPAAIQLMKFLQQEDNAAAIAGSIYLWDDHGSESARGTNADYLTANALGNVNGPNGGKFNGYIGSMQGFFVKVSSPTSDASVKFTEDMRVLGVNSDENYFRKAQAGTQIKLSLSNDEFNYYNELLVGLKDDATIGVDRLYDADKLNGNDQLQFFSYIDGQKYAIQGLPFEQGVSTELGFDLDQDMQLTLKVQEGADGFFLLDKVTGVSYDLNKVSEIKFDASAGSEQNRFELSYGVASILSSQPTINQPIFKYLNGMMSVSTPKGEIRSVSVYNMAGQVLFTQKSVSQNTIDVPVNSAEITIIRVVTSRGTFTRKFAFK